MKKNDYQKRSKKGGKKNVSGVIALVLSGVLALGVIGSGVYIAGKFNGWFEDNKPAVEENVDKETDGETEETPSDEETPNENTGDETGAEETGE